MKKIGAWEVIGELPRGGQGRVYKVRSPKRAGEMTLARQDLFLAIRTLTGITTEQEQQSSLETFVSKVAELSRADDPETELGALKQFDLSGGEDGEDKAAVKRFEREIEALQSVRNPSILRLIEANIEKRWFVAEYHPGGTLADSPLRYHGNALSALGAFRSVVEAVAQVHEKKCVHRDIKSKNVLIAADGHLVLADFGIVFFEDDAHTRLTESFERVGSTDWMAAVGSHWKANR